jgi:chromosome partitioning protein
MKTLVLCNQKGGVGKSAVATLLVHHLARRGRRVVAIASEPRICHSCLS